MPLTLQKAVNLSLSVFPNKTDMSCECKCKFYRRKCNLNQSEITINVDVSEKI